MTIGDQQYTQHHNTTYTDTMENIIRCSGSITNDNQPQFDTHLGMGADIVNDNSVVFSLIPTYLLCKCPYDIRLGHDRLLAPSLASPATCRIQFSSTSNYNTSSFISHSHSISLSWQTEVIKSSQT